MVLMTKEDFFDDNIDIPGLDLSSRLSGLLQFHTLAGLKSLEI